MAVTLTRTSIVVLVGAVAALVSIAAFAEGGKRFGRASPTAPAAQTRIEVDDTTSTIRFYVKGEQVALIDALGLHSIDSPSQ